MTIRDEMIAAPLEKRNAELEAANQELREKGQALLDELDAATRASYRPDWPTLLRKLDWGPKADALRKVIADTQAGKDGS